MGKKRTTIADFVLKFELGEKKGRREKGRGWVGGGLSTLFNVRSFNKSLFTN
jgi:hypothetical protein